VEGTPDEFAVPISGGFFARAPEGIGESYPDDFPDVEELEIAGEPGTDPAAAFRRTLGMFATGVTIITTQAGDQVHGMTANAFMSVSLRPPLVLISVDRRARMHGLLPEGSRYGVSVLADDQAGLSDRFAGRRTGDGPEPGFDIVRETPLVQGALAQLVARVVKSYWGGDHSLFVAQVEYARYGRGQPLLFHGGQYEQLLGRVPLFSALSPHDLAPILASGKERSFAAGETILRQGDPGDELFVIVEGLVRVERDGHVMHELVTGEFFGEVAVLDGRPRSADVVAQVPTRCLTVSREVMRRVLETEPRAVWSMLETLASRLRDD
jgi:flavin reductase (DIM6/NTAB) family NADH-FMN oxidoreductase RutF